VSHSYEVRGEHNVPGHFITAFCDETLHLNLMILFFQFKEDVSSDIAEKVARRTVRQILRGLDGAVIHSVQGTSGQPTPAVLPDPGADGQGKLWSRVVQQRSSLCFGQHWVLHSKIPWYPKLLFQRENACLFLSAEGLGNSTKTLPGQRNFFQI
jgi:hypothetical protein